MTARHFSFFHAQTGVLSDRRISCDVESGAEEIAKRNAPADHLVIEGHPDHLSKRVDVASGAVIDYQPPQPSADHEWNDGAKRWALNHATQDKINRKNIALARIAALEGSQHRALRESALGNSDAVARLQAIDAEIVRLRPDIT